MNSTRHVFPDKIATHILTFRDGFRVSLLVSPSETYGKAMARAGYSDSDVRSIELPDSPIWYEPDTAVASR